MQLSDSCMMTEGSIVAYLQWEQSRGVTENALRRCRRFTASLYEWLPENKIITKELLLTWRQNLKDQGYAPDTEQNYVKGVNRYLDYMGLSDLRFQKGRLKDITGMQFGSLTALEPTGKRKRKDVVWRCRCSCGMEAEFPATRLLTGNTLSCGCLRGEHLKKVNQYYEGTSIRMSLTEQVRSTRAESGYTGVTRKRDKWLAYIRYKGQYYSLGCYFRKEDAIQARARGKELVQKDAMGLLEFYEELHKDDPVLPNRIQIQGMKKEPEDRMRQKSATSALRSNNTSGYVGVSRKRDKWTAKITWQKKTYQLGNFENLEQAVAARRDAERLLQEDRLLFLEKYGIQKDFNICKTK